MSPIVGLFKFATTLWAPQGSSAPQVLKMGKTTLLIFKKGGGFSALQAKHKIKPHCCKVEQ